MNSSFTTSRSLLLSTLIMTMVMLCVVIAMLTLIRNAQASPLRYDAGIFRPERAWYCAGDSVHFTPRAHIGRPGRVEVNRTLWRLDVADRARTADGRAVASLSDSITIPAALHGHTIAIPSVFLLPATLAAGEYELASSARSTNADESLYGVPITVRACRGGTDAE